VFDGLNHFGTRLAEHSSLTTVLYVVDALKCKGSLKFLIRIITQIYSSI
jgi:hypothetical protein